MTRFVSLLCFCIFLSMPALAAPAKSGNSAEPGEKEAARITGSQLYIAVQSLHATVTHDLRFAGVMSVDVGIEFKTEDQKQKAFAYMPRLRDALRGAVGAYVSRSYIPGSVPDFDILHFQLQRAADRVMGPDVATVTIAAAMISTSG